MQSTNMLIQVFKLSQSPGLFARGTGTADVQNNGFIYQNMEGAIKTVVCQFANAAGSKGNLDKKKFQTFLKKNLGNVLTNTGSSSAVDRLIKSMDDNDDGKVSFQEYLGLIGAVAKAFSDNKNVQNRVPN